MRKDNRTYEERMDDYDTKYGKLYLELIEYANSVEYEEELLYLCKMMGEINESMLMKVFDMRSCESKMLG